MDEGFSRNRTKLKTKILLLIFLILIVQIVVISTLSLIIFNRQMSRNTETELTRDLTSTKSELEDLKNRLYNRIHLLKYSLEEMKQPELNRLRLHNIIDTHFSSLNADRAVLVNEDGTTMFSLYRKGSRYPVEKEIDLENFRFISNRFVLSKESIPRLYLVSGTKIYHDSGRNFYLFFINNIDNNFANNLFKENGVNFAIFSGERILSTVVPRFQVPHQVDNERILIKISSTPYLIKSEALPSEITEGLTLVVLRSTLQDDLYKRQLTMIFLGSFIITLVLSLAYTVGITNHILTPFYELNSWMSAYLETGNLGEFRIRRNDEIGFLTRTSRTLVQKLVSEENIIRTQLNEISFLNKYNNVIMNNLKAGVLLINRDSTIGFCNTYLESLLGTPGSELLGRKIEDFFRDFFTPEGHWPDFPVFDPENNDTCPVRLIDNLRPEEMKFIIKPSPLPGTGDNSKTLIVMEDITATERLYNKIMVTEKVSSMGLLSAGMAHEINNPLGSILSHIDYLKMVETEDDKIDSIKWIESETKRIGDIVKRVLTFSSTGETGSEYADVNRIIEEVINISKYSIKKRSIEIITELKGRGTLLARISEDEFKQVFLNLFLNATQAIKSEGTVSVETSLRDKFISIIISDSGHGIKPEDLKNIFNPFFSTKTLKNTSGLGLSITYSIIQRAGGDIQITSTPAKGTVVEVKLPQKENKE